LFFFWIFRKPEFRLVKIKVFFIFISSYAHFVTKVNLHFLKFRIFWYLDPFRKNLSYLVAFFTFLAPKNSFPHRKRTFFLPWS
jgi:hypothetical protein